MADPIKQSKDLVRQLRRIKRQAGQVGGVAGGKPDTKKLADQIAKEGIPGLLARGLIR